MRTTRMDIEGRRGHYATITRRDGGDHIEVQILTPELPDGKLHSVVADSRDDVMSMAECLIFHLGGCRGTNSMIHDYYRQLERFMD
jgi:hypothetical protein